MNKDTFDVVVIGAGPGGYVAAIKAAQLGSRVALVEANYLGGTCLNVGCIPSKALIAGAAMLRQIKKAESFGIHVENVSFNYKVMKERKDEVVSKIRNSLKQLILNNKIEIIEGFGKLADSTHVKVQTKEGFRLLQASKIILATGSKPKIFPPFTIDGNLVHDSSTILDIEKLPKSLAIIGGGYIGCEFASMFDELGVKVILIEAMDRIIALECIQSSQKLDESFRARGIEIHTNSKVIEQTLDVGVTLKLDNGTLIDADMALVAVGRDLLTQDIGLETAGVYVNEKGAIPVNDRLQTNLDHIYAIGDITAKWMLAHTASHQGIVAASNACAKLCTIDYSAVPAVIFTDPEIASVGLTLEQAQKAGLDAKLGQFPFQALGKSQATLDADGFAQVVVDVKTGRILGAQVVGHEAGVLIGQMALAIQNELTLECVAETIHAHPTLSEAWLEATLMAADMPLHLSPRKRR